jgi:metal-responsive CopG/Arc/MetJ family transcriptional regulator
MSPRKPERHEVLWSVRLPAKLAQAIDRRVAKTGQNRSAVVRELLEAGLEKASTADDVLTVLLAEVRGLRRELRGRRGGGR